MRVKDHPLYPTLVGIRQRCLYPSYRQYKNYGGRGVKLYEDWHADPWEFFTYVETHLGAKPKGATLDRIDNDGDYAPGNIRWATYMQQQRNKTTNLRLTLNGVTKCVSEWAEESGISYTTLHRRIALGWSETDMLKPPKKTTKREVKIKGEEHTVAEWASISGVSVTELYRRLQKGITGSDLLLPTRGTK